MNHPLITFLARKVEVRIAAAEVKQAQDVYAMARAALKEARYRATVSVECPVPSCRAEVDTSCRWVRGGGQEGYMDTSPDRVHGLREDLAGLNGIPHQRSAETWSAKQRTG